MPCHPDRLTRQPARMGTRLFATVPAFVVACLLAPLPTVAAMALTGEFGMTTTWGPSAMRALMILPVLAVFTGVFSGPFAVPILVAMALRDVRGLVPHVGLGMLATLPAMAFFVASVPGELTGTVAAAIVAGGALGGFAASAVRDAVEECAITMRDRCAFVQDAALVERTALFIAGSPR